MDSSTPIVPSQPVMIPAPVRHRRGRWMFGVLVLALIAYIAWVGTRPDAPAQLLQTGTGVVALDPPVNVRAGTSVQLQWEVRAPVGAATTHTAIHWGTVSHPDVLGTDVAPATAGYPNMLPDYASGSFGLPRTFTGAVTFPNAGTVAYRAHATIDGLHYWSPEYRVQVE